MSLAELLLLPLLGGLLLVAGMLAPVHGPRAPFVAVLLAASACALLLWVLR